ncbi:ABC transporter ATP-binding protein [Aquabacter sp. CN5-332]|uniref:ABC transporter ATP-binding protein n=1 Tax=Aquabacter sp. CN5-332 TaxID=3156608 RepID=UPI0032B454B7
MFEFRHVTHEFAVRSGAATRALDDITCDVRPGEFLCIIGPSGCGKTTLLNMMAGFTQPTRGEVHYRGGAITGPGPDRTVMFQDYGLFPWMSAAENIAFGLAAEGLRRYALAARVRRFVEMVHLAGFEDRYPDQLSGGMRQRVSIARALAPDPDVVLMDEPFAALDSLTRDLLQEELLGIWAGSGKTFVLITHNIEEAIFLADRILVMRARPGRIKASIDIDLPRPRAPEMRTRDPAFLALKEQVTRLLREEVPHDLAGVQ